MPSSASPTSATSGTGSWSRSISATETAAPRVLRVPDRLRDLRLLVIGSVVGTRLALKGGTPFIRKLFVGLVVVLIARMAWDTFRGA